MNRDQKFEIEGPISAILATKQIYSFQSACEFVQHLSYQRNSNKENPIIILEENCGTCSTKHALLKQLADEQQFIDVKLCLGIIKMNAVAFPQLTDILMQNQLEYIPEAHNYLRIQGKIVDCTFPKNRPNSEQERLAEIEIEANQIGNFKIEFHRKFLQNWLIQHPEIPLSLEELWTIREQCIALL